MFGSRALSTCCDAKQRTSVTIQQLPRPLLRFRASWEAILPLDVRCAGSAPSCHSAVFSKTCLGLVMSGSIWASSDLIFNISKEAAAFQRRAGGLASSMSLCSIRLSPGQSEVASLPSKNVLTTPKIGFGYQAPTPAHFRRLHSEPAINWALMSAVTRLRQRMRSACMGRCFSTRCKM